MLCQSFAREYLSSVLDLDDITQQGVAAGLADVAGAADRPAALRGAEGGPPRGPGAVRRGRPLHRRRRRRERGGSSIKRR